MGVRFADPNGLDHGGKSYLVYGKAHSNTVNLADVAAGTGGFVINGAGGY